MPYSSTAAAHKAAPGLYSVKPGGPIKNLAAINALAKIYDGVKGDPKVKNAAGAAKATFRNGWAHSGSGTWKKKAMTKGVQPMAATDCDVAFTADVVLLKAYEEDGKRLVAFACADDGPDLQAGAHSGVRTVADVIDAEFLAKMARQTIEDGIPLVDSHQTAFPDLAIGTPNEAFVVPAGGERFEKTFKHATLVTVFELANDDKRADDVFQKAKDGNDDRGVSVHGGISRVQVELNKDVGGYVRRIFDGHLDHHALLPAGTAANPRMGTVAAMSKALDEAGVTFADEIEKAEVYVHTPGGTELKGYVRTEDDEYKRAGYDQHSFEGAYAAAKLRVEIPRMNDLFKSVIDNILDANDEEVPDKRAALIAAANEYRDAIEALLASGGLSKSQADELTEEAETTVAEATETTDGGEAAETEEDPMAGTVATEEVVEPQVASLEKRREDVNAAIAQFDVGDEYNVPELPKDDLGKALELLTAGAERAEELAKAFATLPVVDSMGAVNSGQRQHEMQISPGARNNSGGMTKEQIGELIAETVAGTVEQLRKAEEDGGSEAGAEGEEAGAEPKLVDDVEPKAGSEAEPKADEEPKPDLKALETSVQDMVTKAIATVAAGDMHALNKGLGSEALTEDPNAPSGGETAKDAFAFRLAQDADGDDSKRHDAAYYAGVLTGEKR